MADEIPIAFVAARRFFPGRRRLASVAPVLALLIGSATLVAAAEPGAYGELLAAHVRPGVISGVRLNVVDYAGLAADPRYATALGDLAAADPDRLAGEADRFAFWINAYNLLAIKMVVDHPGVAGIRDVGSLLWPVWKRSAGSVGGKAYSLDDIEQGILRPRFHDPRVHFAIVCASVSCPDLRAAPYDGPHLDAELDAAARAFLSNPSKGLVVDATAKTVSASSIFRWFSGDFAAAGGVLAFVRAKAAPEVVAEAEGFGDADLLWLDYDWSLNDAARSR